MKSKIQTMRSKKLVKLKIKLFFILAILENLNKMAFYKLKTVFKSI